jgi:hypothetical protein
MFDKVGLTVVCVEVIVLAVERCRQGIELQRARGKRLCREEEREKERRSNREMENVKSTYLHVRLVSF